jgi:hypothetical protein
MNYRLVAHPTDRNDYVHVHAMVMRAGAWMVCGIFQLLSCEWPPFEAICKTNGIEVEIEQPLPSAIAKKAKAK